MSTPERTIAAYFSALRAMDREAWVATFAADGVSHDPVGAPPHVGHDGIRRFFDGVAGLVESIALWEDDVCVRGNRAAAAWTMVGRGKNGAPFRVRGIDTFDFDARGKIQRVEAWWPAEQLIGLLTS